MIKVKVYYYDSSKTDNGYRGTDYSNYVLQGGENLEDLTQELDFSEITLMGIERATAFEPATKFIIDITVDGQIANSSVGEPLTYHRIVKEDYVTKIILNNEAQYKHEISLIEPSAIAQKTLVDNISCTYKLKDVSLETKSPYDKNENAPFNASLPTSGVPVADFICVPPVDTTSGYWKGLPIKFAKKLYWEDTPIYLSLTNGYGYTNKYYVNVSDTQSTNIYIKIPKLKIWQTTVSEKDSYSDSGFALSYYTHLGYASLHYSIYEKNSVAEIESNSNLIKEGNIISNSNLNAYNYNEPFVQSDNYNREYLNERPFGSSKTYIRRYTDVNAPNPNYTVEIAYKPDKFYSIIVSLYDFTYTGTTEIGYARTNNLILSYYKLDYGLVGGSNEVYDTIPKNDTSCSSRFFIYDVTPKSVLLSAGKPYSALLFIQKAICNTKVEQKLPFTYSGDINFIGTARISATETYNGYLYPSLFYIDPQYVDILAKTTIIENFYHQKNLWEILIEIGYYIHAIPELKFGENNKLMITFNKLGQTTETSDNATPMLVTNFRGIDDYICETNSYVSNMVQLGGQITEIVAPKSSSEDYLVYNDVAEIQVSKPIIELLKVEVFNPTAITLGGKTYQSGYYDATKYFYEQNVYKLLGIEYNAIPNKGIAMYYSLRDNKIVGGNYQLPQANKNIYSDYTFKKIIYCAITGNYPIDNTKPATGYWSNLIVNNFAFRITYRTQDSVRATHTRPDIRKYLNLPYAIFPTIPVWQQFNNQQDIVVDSEKFGNNIYGALIRTGNNNYQMQEWVDHPSKLKVKGEIFKIDNEIYYVAKVKNSFYNEHITSVVTYSKDYNQLSKVVGIPSEPRFYEISEQSTILRDVSINDYLLISTNQDMIEVEPNNYSSLQDTTHLKDLVLGADGVEFSKYVITSFKGDNSIGILDTTYGLSTLKKDIITPLNAYASGTTLIYSWAMKDNFSAGDKISKSESTTTINKNSVSYRSLEAVQYTDQYGKATLFDFYVLKDIPDAVKTMENIRNFPLCPYVMSNTDNFESLFNDYVTVSNVNEVHNDYNARGLVLLKDSRETIRFNYNLSAITDSDTFIVSSNIFEPKNKCNIAFCSQEINKLSNGTLSQDSIIKRVSIDDSVEFITKPNAFNQNKNSCFYIKISDIVNANFTDNEKQQIKSIALIHDYSEQQSLNLVSFSVAKNIPSIEYLNKNWYFGIPNIEKLFTNKQ